MGYKIAVALFALQCVANYVCKCVCWSWANCQLIVLFLRVCHW